MTKKAEQELQDTAPAVSEGAEAAPAGASQLVASETDAPQVNEAATESQATPDEEEIVAHAIQVTAMAATFRRAGRVFGHEPVEIDLDDLDEDELEMIMTEPQLIVVVIPADAELGA